jgi:hypothetical protein
VAGEIVRQRQERDLQRCDLEREVQGDGATEKRRSPLVIVAWIVAGTLAMLAVLVLSSTGNTVQHERQRKERRHHREGRRHRCYGHVCEHGYLTVPDRSARELRTSAPVSISCATPSAGCHRARE